jgi:hypothetical protein
VVVTEDNERMEYEYGNIKHAKEQFETEEHAELLEYKEGKHHLVEVK